MGSDARDLLVSIGTADSEFSWQLFVNEEIHGVRMYAQSLSDKLIYEVIKKYKPLTFNYLILYYVLSK